MKAKHMFNDTKFLAHLEPKDKAFLRRIIVKNDPQYTKQNEGKLNRVRDMYRKYKKYGRV